MTDLRGVYAYHALSKHRPQHYAPGPGYLDWASQPAPFRRYAGAALVELPHRPLEQSPAYEAVFAAPLGEPAPLNLVSLGQLLYDSLALSAWKEAGGNRWALRVNPSSGNLHPTEAYLLLPPGVAGESGLLAHYAPDEHALEIRSELPSALGEALAGALPAGGFLLGLSSIAWREAWKYGERAYRYCQHDLGHAQAALAIAASALGWQVRLLHGVAEARLEGRILPVQRTRATGIAGLAGLPEKIRAWAEAAEVQPEPMLACLAALETGSPEQLAQDLLQD